MTINLPIILDRNCRLGFLEMLFQDIKISKFSVGAFPQVPLVKFRFSDFLRLDSLVCRFQFVCNTSIFCEQNELFWEENQTKTFQIADPHFRLYISVYEINKIIHGRLEIWKCYISPSAKVLFCIYYMAEYIIQSVRKMTHVDWLPGRAISFWYRLASFGGKISELVWRQTNQI